MDTVIDIKDDPTVEHKREMFSYVPPPLQTADEIETEVAAVDDDFTRTKAKYDQINDAATEQKKQNIITDLIDDIIDETNPYQNMKKMKKIFLILNVKYKKKINEMTPSLILANQQ